jgi:hypothetical protein
MRRPFKLAIVISVILASGAASAKRRAPKDVAPVTAKGIVYKVPHFGFFHQKEQNGGFVQAWDAKTKKLLWDRMVYRIVYDRDVEGDVQDVFITKIQVVGNKLVVTNEEEEKFEMDLPSGQFRALTPLNERRRFGRREVPDPESKP